MADDEATRVPNFGDDDCRCIYQGKGRPLDFSLCQLHPHAHYECQACALIGKSCTDYRPVGPPIRMGGLISWRLCVCWHSAADHIPVTSPEKIKKRAA